ncbi:hypothetical protein E1B28_010998 [Marasmius oreades]|uniref:RING-type domain-containing protein n=1 Tax=Marasmius oreades TaxID=181124 RepID=A0A9P7UPR4_9AGAR|nr:uncharacterized protein E1B28_010998 [Marasmius oreades]KAG7089300.1 hypothetical protein E1B28_010998 [Marasmius oreades]
MLISHPSSSCDVCLEPYRFESDGSLGVNKRHPHVLPCGHVFCKGCLDGIIVASESDWKCPMCRHPFRLADAISKLHIEGLEEEASDDLLRALYEAWDSTNGSHLNDLVVRAEKMLQGKEEIEHVGLRIALKALSERKARRFEVTENERIIRTYRRMLGSSTRSEQEDRVEDEEEVGSVFTEVGDVFQGRDKNKCSGPGLWTAQASRKPQHWKSPGKQSLNGRRKSKSSPILEETTLDVAALRIDDDGTEKEKTEKASSPKVQDPIRFKNTQHERRKSLGPGISLMSNSTSSKANDKDIYYSRRLSLLFR